MSNANHGPNYFEVDFEEVAKTNVTVSLRQISRNSYSRA
jgi:hypothetical protein